MDDKLDHRIAEVRTLMETQLRVKGRDLRQQMRRAGRLLPRTVRRDVGYLADASEITQNPKLSRMVDPTKVEKAHRNVVSFLEKQDPSARRWDRIISFTASIALIVVVVFVVMLYVLVQRGYV